MKKLIYVVLVLLLLVSVSVFGAWAPIAQAETELRYADAPIVSTLASTQIYYTSRVIDEGETAGGAPLYNYSAGYANACGPIAGTAIVAFYDKYYPELIPDWESYYPATGKYRLQVTTYTTPVLSELYTLMQTNVKGDGVSESEFKTGLQTYITNRGYSVSYTNVKSGSSLNYSACKAAIDSNKVIALFIKPGIVYDIWEYSDHDTFVENTIAGNHIMYAYGYFQLKYYDSTGLFRTETFLEVSVGQPATTFAYYKVDSSNLEAAYVVNVG
ncbi:MAG: hypothetical protein J1F66_01355 [Clostridiales bacterium]|nr:hypothetical protein [Clostridiales bacterium]